jgi:hypothetical protein
MTGIRKTQQQPEPQKISFLLPDDLATKLRQHAIRQKTKVGPLLRQWIEERLVKDGAVSRHSQ